MMLDYKPTVSHPRADERTRALAILDACAHKPVRRVTTESLGHLEKLRCVSWGGNLPDAQRNQEKQASRKLQTEVVSYLLEHGSATGKELAAALNSTVGRIGKACVHCMIGRRLVLDRMSKSENLLFYIRRST